MDDWVVFWCTMLALEPKEKLFILFFKLVHWRICEIKMISIRITLVKWWQTTRDCRRQTKCSSTLCGCLCTQPTWYSGIVVCNPFKFYVHFFWSKIIGLCVYACNSSETNFIPQPQQWKVIGGKHNALVCYVNVCAPDPAGVVLWNPFIWDILWFILIKNLVIFVRATTVKRIFNFIPQPLEQKSGRRQTQCSSTLCGC